MKLTFESTWTDIRHRLKLGADINYWSQDQGIKENTFMPWNSKAQQSSYLELALPTSAAFQKLNLKKYSKSGANISRKIYREPN